MTAEPKKKSLKDEFKHAFDIGESESLLSDDEEKFLEEIAQRIHAKRLSAAAIPFLLVNRPLNTIGANMIQMGEIVFTAGPVERFLQQILGPSYSHERLVRTMEKRIAIDRLVYYLELEIDKQTGR